MGLISEFWDPIRSGLVVSLKWVGVHLVILSQICFKTNCLTYCSIFFYFGGRSYWSHGLRGRGKALLWRHDKVQGGDVKNCTILRDVIYGRPLIPSSLSRLILCKAIKVWMTFFHFFELIRFHLFLSFADFHWWCSARATLL